MRTDVAPQARRERGWGTEVRDMVAVPLSAVVLADETQTYTYDSLKPGPMAFIVISLLAVAVFFLVRSMLKQLRKVDFDEQARTDAERTKSHRANRPKAPG
jgi:hypothetical protein